MYAPHADVEINFTKVVLALCEMQQISYHTSLAHVRQFFALELVKGIIQKSENQQ